jgi:GTP cyclohydrolase IA
MNEQLQTALANALKALSLDSADPELEHTPERVAALWSHWLVPPERPMMRPIPTPDNGVVVVRDLVFHSLCAHHLVPFFGHVHIAYRPAGQILGFGSFGRLLDWCARRPQLQERLVQMLATELEQCLQPAALVVVAQARQMCVELTDCGHAPSTIAIAGRGEWASDGGWNAAGMVLGMAPRVHP